MCYSNGRFLTEDACNKDCRSAQVTESLPELTTVITERQTERFTTSAPTASHSDGDESSFPGGDEDSTENADVRHTKGLGVTLWKPGLDS